MKILFLIPSYKPAYVYGGTIVSVSSLAEALVEQKHSVTVYTTTANGNSELDVSIGEPVWVNGVEVYYFERITGDHTHASPGLWYKLLFTVKKFDLVSLHSWWSLLIIGAALICKIKKVAFVITPHGTLSSYTFKNNHPFYKKVFHYLLGKLLLNNSILLATSLLEREECKSILGNWNGFTLHNMINLPKSSNPDSRKKNSIFTIGFLSRIDPKKGIELLIQALASVPFDYKLLLAGNGDEKYLKKLKEFTVELGIEKKLQWCGWKDGEEKFVFLKELDLFVLPSFNENFAISVTESLAVGTPVIVSDRVGLADYVIQRKLGWVCKVSAVSLKEELCYVYDHQRDLERIREAAPAIIAEDFNKETLVSKYISCYMQILKENK